MDDAGTSFWEPCWSCRVTAGETFGCAVAEAPDVLVLLNPFPLSPGHSLVVPRRHVRDLYELPENLAEPILLTVARVARALKRAFGAHGVTLRQNNGAASDQHLFHFHLHVIPRFEGITKASTLNRAAPAARSWRRRRRGCAWLYWLIRKNLHKVRSGQ